MGAFIVRVYMYTRSFFPLASRHAHVYMCTFVSLPLFIHIPSSFPSSIRSYIHTLPPSHTPNQTQNNTTGPPEALRRGEEGRAEGTETLFL